MGFATLAEFSHVDPFERARAISRYVRAAVCFADARGAPLHEPTNDDLRLRAIVTAMQLPAAAPIFLELGAGVVAVEATDRAGDDNLGAAGLTASLARCPALEVDQRGTRGEPGRPLTPGGDNLRTRSYLARWSEGPLPVCELARGVRLLGQGLLALPPGGGRHWLPESLIVAQPAFLAQSIADAALGRSSLNETHAREAEEALNAADMAGARRHSIT